MTRRPIVVKVGGSLFSLPGLEHRLHRWLTSQGNIPFMLVPGGGPAADLVREWDRCHALGDEASHWLALRSLTFTAHLLAGLLGRARPCRVVSSCDACAPAWALGQTPVLDLHAFAIADEGNPGCLPHLWTVTSDALAARVAQVAGAAELVLLKSVTIPPCLLWEQAAQAGYVDPTLARLAEEGLPVRAVNLREIPVER